MATPSKVVTKNSKRGNARSATVINLTEEYGGYTADQLDVYRSARATAGGVKLTRKQAAAEIAERKLAERAQRLTEEQASAENRVREANERARERVEKNLGELVSVSALLLTLSDGGEVGGLEDRDAAGVILSHFREQMVELEQSLYQLGIWDGTGPVGRKGREGWFAESLHRQSVIQSTSPEAAVRALENWPCDIYALDDMARRFPKSALSLITIREAAGAIRDRLGIRLRNASNALPEKHKAQGEITLAYASVAELCQLLLKVDDGAGNVEKSRSVAKIGAAMLASVVKAGQAIERAEIACGSQPTAGYLRNSFSDPARVARK